MDNRLKALTIGAFDPVGTTGVAADRSTLNGFGIDAVTIVGSIVLGPGRVAPVGPETLRTQLKTFGDLSFSRMVKTGQLGTRENIESVSSCFEDSDLDGRTVVVDASVDEADGAPILSNTALSLLKMRLLPLADLVVVYLSEASKLAGTQVETITQMKEAAAAIHIYGAKHVLVRADRQVDDELVDILYDGREHRFLFRKTAPQGGLRLVRDIFSTAAMAYLSQGRSLQESLELAQKYELQPMSVPQDRLA